jgi:hypothetical protein
MAGQTNDRLEQRAIRQNWPLSDDAKIKCLKRITQLLDEEHPEGKIAKHRTRVAAMKVVRDCLKQDQDYEIDMLRLELDAQRLELARSKQTQGEAVTIDVIARAQEIRERRAARIGLPAPDA